MTEYDFTGYLSTFGNLDRDNDRFVKGAFDKSLKNDGTRFPMLANHNTNEVIGYADLSVDSKGLIAKAKFAGTAKALEQKHLVETGAITKMSIGFIPTDYEENEKNDGWSGWDFKSVEILEATVCPLPANKEATIFEVNSTENDSESDDHTHDENASQNSESKSVVLNIEQKKEWKERMHEINQTSAD